jgi:hypothetical protein
VLTGLRVVAFGGGIPSPGGRGGRGGGGVVIIRLDSQVDGCGGGGEGWFHDKVILCGVRVC